MTKEDVSVMQQLKQGMQILTHKLLQKKIKKSIVDYESFKMETVRISLEPFIMQTVFESETIL